ncbi:MAG: acyltransferase domain-containing protein [Ketobacter sp.]|mgnify:CR=1 FL=1|nr:MAG: acyltransferase domain-containing protein [Ketobacter sp.]
MNNINDKQQDEIILSALQQIKNARKKIEQYESQINEPIAIIGIGCKFPGGANTPELLWDMLEQGEQGIREMRQERWVMDDFYSPDKSLDGKMYTRSIGLLDDVDKFDADFFGITPIEAKSMDPQHRITLETCWQAIENAGLIAADLRDSQTGTFLGICHHDYANLAATLPCERITPYDGTGNAHSAASGRIAYLMGFKGPAISVDTACSSSLVSLHLACESLRKGDSEIALAGGINLALIPNTSVIFSKANMLAEDGRCKTFDASADGYVRGEGCGIVVLKRLSDAVRDGNNVLAVVKGSAVNQDGQSQGLTAPNETAQVSVIQSALKHAGINHEQVNYIEAHGTGTNLGDPIEVAALGQAYCQNRAEDNPLLIGSIKTNIGHTEAAAGIAGVIKTVLALQNEQIPRHLNYTTPNPFIDWHEGRIRVVADAVPWPKNQRDARIAGISSFGFSGTNAHIILQDFQCDDVSQDNQALASRSHFPFVFGAKSEQALIDLVEQHLVWADLQSSLSCEKWSHSLTKSRDPLSHRLAFVASSVDDIKMQLKAFVDDAKDEKPLLNDAWYFNTYFGKPCKVAFMYTGQGSHYINMGRELYQREPAFKQQLDQCEQILLPLIGLPLTDILWGEHSDKLAQNQYTQAAITSLQIALTYLWQSWNITPSVVMGHSIGEYAASYAAGVLSLQDALSMVALRGKLTASMTEKGAMLAVYASVEEVDALASKAGWTDYDIAAINGPKNTVLAGSVKSINSIAESLENHGLKYKLLEVEHAFHSYLMDPILDEYKSYIQNIRFSRPNIAFVSAVSGDLVNQEITSIDYWIDHIRKPVQFSGALVKTAMSKPDIIIEVGPDSILTNMAQYCLGQCPKDVRNIPVKTTLHANEPWAPISDALAQLACLGHDIHWSAVDSVSTNELYRLPYYPFQRKHYWLDGLRTPNVEPTLESFINSASYCMQWKNIEIDDHPKCLPQDVLIISDHVEYAESLKAAYIRYEIPCEIISTCDTLDFGAFADGDTTADTQIIVLLGGRPNSEFCEGGASIAIRYTQALVSLAKRFDKNNSFSLNFVTSQDPALSACQGFIKSLRMERPQFVNKLLVADEQALTDSAENLLYVLNDAGDEFHFQLSGGDVSSCRLQKDATLNSKKAASLSQAHSYLVTGGTGGIGWNLACSMIESGASHLILTSRRGIDGLSEEQQAQIASWLANGIRVGVEAVDCASEEQMD